MFFFINASFDGVTRTSKNKRKDGKKKKTIILDLNQHYSDLTTELSLRDTKS